MSKYAPVILFVYNRLDHTKQTINALSKNTLAKETQLIIYSDGAKNNANQESVNNVRKFINDVQGFESVSIIKRDKNIGLADSIVMGVTENVEKYGKVIVLEDDIVTSPFFLQYMNDALDFYENEDRVMHIAGYMYPVPEKLPETFFFSQASCWGWATWKRAWKYYNADARFLLDRLLASKSIKRFNIGDNADFLDHLVANVDGRIKTWAIKWYASVFLNGGTCLHPGESLANNIGMDSTGVHCTDTNMYENVLDNARVQVTKIPIEDNEYCNAILGKYLRKLDPGIRGYWLFLKKNGFKKTLFTTLKKAKGYLILITARPTQ